jgi:hypothetical protein
MSRNICTYPKASSLRLRPKSMFLDWDKDRINTVPFLSSDISDTCDFSSVKPLPGTDYPNWGTIRI